jgi:hypothetical protein
MRIKLILLALCIGSSIGFAQKKYNRILLENATVHIGNGQVFEKGTVGIENGKIKLVRNALAFSYNREEWDTVINLSGQHLYPGFVAPNSTLGLTEIEAVNASNDFYEFGEFNPNMRAQIAFNCESNVIQTVRTNGVLLIQTTPRGGTIAGQSSVMRSDCWNWEDGTVLESDGIHVEWPNPYKMNWPTRQLTKNDEYQNQKERLRSFFLEAKGYALSNGKENQRYDAMKQCFKGEKRVYFRANDMQQILDVLDFAKELEIAYPVIVGGYDSYLVTDRLKLQQVPVMLVRLHSLPQHEDDPVDLVYRLPFLLQQAGVKFCLQNEGDMEAMNARNIPFLAGTAYSYGLTEEQAIRCVSLSSCEILGIDKNYGSIEEGKSATLFVSQGPALEMKTNQTTLILIDGQFIPVTNFQLELYKKYKQKYKL